MKKICIKFLFLGICFVVAQSLQASSEIVSSGSFGNGRACLHDFGNFNNENVIVNLSCHEVGHQRQKWSYDSRTKSIRNVESNRCLDASVPGSRVVTFHCNGNDYQKWEYTDSKQLKSLKYNKCIVRSDYWPYYSGGYFLKLEDCNVPNTSFVSKEFKINKKDVTIGLLNKFRYNGRNNPVCVNNYSGRALVSNICNSSTLTQKLGYNSQSKKIKNQDSKCLSLKSNNLELIFKDCSNGTEKRSQWHFQVESKTSFSLRNNAFPDKCVNIRKSSADVIRVSGNIHTAGYSLVLNTCKSNRNLAKFSLNSDKNLPKKRFLYNN